MYESYKNLLKMHGIKIEEGLTSGELIQIEKIYGIDFPQSLRGFLKNILPTSEGFYNWRNTREDNVKYIKQMIQRPIQDIIHMADEVYWCDRWGKEAEDGAFIKQEVCKRARKAPQLLPVYGHRYMPMIPENDPPVISVHGVDVICYGKNLEDYLQIEFGEKKQETIDVKSIKPIPFWSEIM